MEKEENVPQLILSPSYGELFDALKKRLMGAPLLSKPHVIVPSKVVKDDLMRSLAREEEVGVAAGFRVMQPQAFLEHIWSLSQKGISPVFPSQPLMSLHLQTILSTLKQMSELQSYLEKLGKGEKKLEHFSDIMSQQFIRYGEIGADYLKEWLKKRGWQQDLWQHLYSKWNYLYECFDQKRDFSLAPSEVHIFYHSHYPGYLLHLIAEIPSNVTIYHLTPTAVFSGDILSPKEEARFQRKALSQGVAFKEREAFRDLTAAEHPLLRSFGAQQRLNFSHLEEWMDFAEERDFTQRKNHLLNRLQEEVYIGEASENQEVDDSVEVHSAPSKLREVEELYNANVKRLYICKAGGEEWIPSDFLVLVSDIAAYAPFIKRVFGSDESLLDYQISGLSLFHQSTFLESFFHLLSLGKGRWSTKEIFTLIEAPVVTRRFRWSKKDLDRIKMWIEEVGVNWGYDAAHRKALFSGEQDERGTWASSLQKLLKSLAFESDLKVNFAEAELLGSFVNFMHLLKSKTLDLPQGKKPLSHWIEEFQSIVSEFFRVDSGIAHEVDGLQEAMRKMQLLQDLEVSFESATSTLRKLLEKKRGGFQTSHVGGIRFAPFKPGQILPAKSIALLGFDEEAIPRKEIKSTFNEFYGGKGCDRMPTPNEEDRHLFLEALLAAQEELKIFYCSMSESDGKRRGPSLLVEELDAYLEGKLVKKEHSPISFHKSCFENGSNFIPKAYDLAKKYYDQAPKSVRCIHALSPKPNETIDIADLMSCVKNPLKFYMKETLGIQLPEKRDQKEFELTPLERYKFREHYLQHGEIKSLGQMPSGAMARVVMSRLEKELNELKKGLKALGEARLFTCSMQEGCQESFWHTEDLLVLPAVELQDGKKLVGQLEMCSQKGIITSQKTSGEALLKLWPILLAMKSNPDLQKHVELTLFDLSTQTKRDFSSIPQAALSPLISYYEEASIYPSPLLPQLVKPTLQEDKDLFLKTALQSIKGIRGNYVDPYTKFFFSSCNEEDLVALYERWEKRAREVYEPFLTWNRDATV